MSQFRARHSSRTPFLGAIALLLLMTFAAAPVRANLPQAALLDMLRVQVTEAFKKRNNGEMVSAIDRYRVTGGTPGIDLRSYQIYAKVKRNEFLFSDAIPLHRAARP